MNRFVRESAIKSVIEYGSGDGNQLTLAQYPSYTGFDVSPKAVAKCRQLFAADSTKQFKLVDEYAMEMAQATLSLDVIYHLVEDDIYHGYMTRLFDSSEAFVVIYSSNTNENHENQAVHVRHRKFTEWIEKHKPEWKLRDHIPNKYPFQGDTESGSFADFFVYVRD